MIMKHQSFILLVLLAILLLGILSCEKDNCIEQPKEGCICIMIYDPVCGCNGVTYGNSCEAGCAGIKVIKDGTCN